jgi:hypothetical protein
VAATKRIYGLDERLPAAVRANNATEITRLTDLIDGERKPRTEAAVDLGTKNCGA